KALQLSRLGRAESASQTQPGLPTVECPAERQLVRSFEKIVAAIGRAIVQAAAELTRRAVLGPIAGCQAVVVVIANPDGVHAGTQRPALRDREASRQVAPEALAVDHIVIVHADGTDRRQRRRAGRRLI